MTTRKVPPPPPDADLSPFEVGAYLAGHIPDYTVDTIQIGGKTQAERIESHRRYLSPEGFAAWLETEDARRADDPLQTIEVDGFNGSMTIDQAAEAWGEVGKPAEIQAAHLEAVKVNRKATATTAKKVADLPKARGERSKVAADRRERVLNVAIRILGEISTPKKPGLKPKKPTIHKLGGLVADQFPEREEIKQGDWKPSQKAASHMLSAERNGVLKGKVQPLKNRSRD